MSFYTKTYTTEVIKRDMVSKAEQAGHRVIEDNHTQKLVRDDKSGVSTWGFDYGTLVIDDSPDNTPILVLDTFNKYRLATTNTQRIEAIAEFLRLNEKG